jgi:hypothetical protein
VWDADFFHIRDDLFGSIKRSHCLFRKNVVAHLSHHNYLNLPAAFQIGFG